MQTRAEQRRTILRNLAIFQIHQYFLLTQDLHHRIYTDLDTRHNGATTWGYNRGYADRVVQGLLDGDEVKYQWTTRITRRQFDTLLAWLEINTTLKKSRTASTKQKLMIFLYICGTGASYRSASVLFHCSISQISSIFHDVLPAVCALHKANVLVPQSGEPVHPRIALDNKYSPFLDDCVGAIAGNHIPVIHKSKTDRPDMFSAAAFRNRNSTPSQNILAAVDMSMNFLCVHAGWEASAHDGTVLVDAIASRNIKPPPSKFWVADAGHMVKDGDKETCLVPYQSVRYHLKEWVHGEQKPKNEKELFNLRHSSIRNVVERTFGVFKARFKIVETTHNGFSLRTQIQLVYALTALHNFINAHGEDPWAEWDVLDSSTPTEVEDVSPIQPDSTAQTNMELLRDQIAVGMWKQYQSTL
jgi:hypothetical protein